MTQPFDSFQRFVAAALHPGGKTLAAGGGIMDLGQSGGYNAYLWDLETGEMLHRLGGHSQRVVFVQFSPDGALLASAAFDEVFIWDASYGKRLDTLEGYGGPVNSITFAPDGRLVSGSSDRTIRLWHLPQYRDFSTDLETITKETGLFLEDTGIRTPFPGVGMESSRSE